MRMLDDDLQETYAWRPTQAQIKQLFDAATLDRGRALLQAGQVLRVARLGDGEVGVQALVQGTQPRPYTCTVQLAQHGDAPRIVPICTCAVGYACKHTAAVLLSLANEDVPAHAVNPVVQLWAQRLRSLRASDAATATKAAKAPKDRLFYLLEASDPAAPAIEIRKAPAGADGLPAGRAQPWTNVEQALRRTFAFMDEHDARALRLLWLYAGAGHDTWDSRWQLPARGGDELVAALAHTGRLVAAGRQGAMHLLTLGLQPRAAVLGWQVGQTGRQRPVIRGTDGPAGEAEQVLLLDRPWRLDAAGGTIEPLALDGIDMPALRLLFELPGLGAADTLVVAQALGEAPRAGARPATARDVPSVAVDLVPTLLLNTLDVEQGLFVVHAHRRYPMAQSYQHPRYSVARVQWHYVQRGAEAGAEPLSFSIEASAPVSQGKHWVLPAAAPPHFVVGADGLMVKAERSADAEVDRLRELLDAALQPVPPRVLMMAQAPSRRQPLWGLESEADWPAFFAQGLPALRARGWRVIVDRRFAHRLYQVDAWHASVEEQAGEDDARSRWMVSLGIDVAGRRLDLAPLLAALLRREPRWGDRAFLDQVADEKPLHLVAPDGVNIEVPAGRVKPLLRHLIDLFDDPGEGALPLSRWDAMRVAEAIDRSRWQFSGADAVLALAERLRAAGGVRGVKPPRGLGLTLRPYQLDGLAWLQYLREHDLAGILADDMGLGKTAQTLAHVLLEKQAGRLDRPALVVLPTSLVFNWQAEAARVAPKLRVLNLHGADRAERFAQIAKHDLVLTTYPLLWRDADALVQHEYHLLILDEAQTVKNAASRGAETVRRFRARHRLCLTGTPLENHLGELWTQFDFLLPGFLGDAKQFARQWRAPVEKHGQALRAELLARRVRPFILRRRKDEVAQELPPKTVIVRRVPLQGAQRELYESVRIAVDEKLRQEIAARGLARSQIAVLDALLKLRQVCCDPRLVKRVKVPKQCERAKLELLTDMLPELVAEGRRVLLFSQFTEMLELIEQELPELGIDWIKLTGDSRDRGALVKRFQAGHVPLFLISLKAGGVGLNLTAADTVIHFDPWWNPAAEDQATDRAHRIGQDKPVFVYKFVAEGSIEERILALQEKKAQLAATVLGADGAGAAKFGEADIEALLAPLG
jgi:superfamily II DNA or RNA helicase